MIKKLMIMACLLFICRQAYADGYWLQLKGSGKVNDTLVIKIQYGGVTDDKQRYLKPQEELGKLKDFSLFVVDGHGRRLSIPISQKQDGWQGFYVPKAAGTYQVLAINELLPVVERPDTLQNIKPVQYLCAAYIVGNGLVTNIPPQQSLYIRVAINNGQAVIEPFINHKPVPGKTKLRVFYPGNTDSLLHTAGDGKATLHLNQKGPYIIRLDRVDETSGEYNGKRYYAVRHRCDYSLVVY